MQSQTITALRSQYAEVMRREAEQMTSLGERHPAVIEIQAQAERLRRMIDDEVNRIALSARSEYESAHANEDMLARSLEALKHNAVVTNEAMVTLRELERDVQASRAVYEAFLVRARETGEQERLDTKNIRMISRADLPLRRSFPPSNLILALAALLLGIVAGDRHHPMCARQATSAAAATGRRAQPVRRPAKSRAGSKPARRRQPDVPVLAVLPGVDELVRLGALSDPKSRFARDIRKVYEAVQASHNKRGNPSLLVVASDEDDDTAAVALNARGGRRIDATRAADRRRSRAAHAHRRSTPIRAKPASSTSRSAGGSFPMSSFATAKPTSISCRSSRRTAAAIAGSTTRTSGWHSPRPSISTW